MVSTDKYINEKDNLYLNWLICYIIHTFVMIFYTYNLI